MKPIPYYYNRPEPPTIRASAFGGHIEVEHNCDLSRQQAVALWVELGIQIARSYGIDPKRMIQRLKHRCELERERSKYLNSYYDL